MKDIVMGDLGRNQENVFSPMFSAQGSSTTPALAHSIHTMVLFLVPGIKSIDKWCISPQNMP